MDVDEMGERTAASPGGSPRPQVVVGIDGSPGSREALVQALIAAARRGADLDVVSSYSIQLYYLGGRPVDVPDVASIRDDQEERARAVVEEVQAEIPVSGVSGIRDVAVTVSVTGSPPAQALLERAEGAALLVVGSRGRGGVRSALLGSVALHCVTHARCPVLVVHPAAVVRQPPRVVVGVDGSDGSRAALAAAIDEAARTGAEVEAVTTYVQADYWTDLSSVVLPAHEQIVGDLQERTRALVREVLATAPDEVSRVPVRAEVFQGPAAEILVHRGAAPHLLVVGQTAPDVDPAAIGGAIGPRTKAVIPVDLFGQMASDPRVFGGMGGGKVTVMRALLHVFAVCLQDAGVGAGLGEHLAQHGQIQPQG